MLTNEQIKQIKRHQAYNYNVSTEGEANVSLVQGADGFFSIDDWGTDSEGYGQVFRGIKLDGLNLKQALDIILRANKVNEREGRYSISWNMDKQRL